jgi:hypothetical protein
MTSGTPLSAFEHDPLPESTTHFRLLHILRGEFGQHVECEISAWPINDAPSYYAISYTWGDPADSTEITVNGKPLVVRRNCQYVLQQAFATKASHYYWVDAICIDQTSIQERGHQVGIMGEIYSRAKHVFACVGPHADESEYLMATVDQRQPFLGTVHKWGQSTPFYDVIDMRHSSFYNPFSEHARRQIRCLLTMHTSEGLRVSKAWIAFMQRPYFTRVWVLQELYLATRVSYCCGTDVQPGECFRALDSLLEYWMRRHSTPLSTKLTGCREWILRRCTRVDKLSHGAWQSLLRDFRVLEPSRSCLRLAVSARKQSLDNTLKQISHFHCLDDRDNLYGILSLVEWPHGRRPAPDYNKDNFAVAAHTFSLWYEEGIYESPISQCYNLFKLFHVTLECASLRDAIALRSSIVPQASPRVHDNHDSQIPKIHHIWRGVQISHYSGISEFVGGQSQDKLSPCYMEQEQNERFVRIRVGSAYTVCAPADTRVGDWCLLVRWDHTAHECYGVILRESPEHIYIVVGPAFVEYGDDNHGDYQYDLVIRSLLLFMGMWDAEDMMVLLWNMSQFQRHKASDEEIQRFVNTRICGWKDSTYFKREIEE